MTSCSKEQTSPINRSQHQNNEIFANQNDTLVMADYIKITKQAIDKLEEQVEQQKQKILSTNKEETMLPAGIRITTPQKGCSGLTYKMDYAYYNFNITKKDEYINLNTTKLFIAPESIFILFGTEIDFKENEIDFGFVFNNPNQKGSCGCGESFKI